MSNHCQGSAVIQAGANARLAASWTAFCQVGLTMLLMTATTARTKIVVQVQVPAERKEVFKHVEQINSSAQEAFARIHIPWELCTA